MKETSFVLVADVDFNRDDDREEFGCHRRIVDVVDEPTSICLTFELNRKEDDTITLIFDKTPRTLTIE